jgi:hypothetical protein
MRASETPQIPGLSEEARGAPAASEQPKRRFSTEKTRIHHTWLEIKDQAQLGFSQHVACLKMEEKVLMRRASKRRTCAESCQA